MEKIVIKKLSEEEINKMGIKSWSIWTKEKSKFGWHYDAIEECLILEGKARVTTDTGEAVEFGKGDFVTFPKGIDCTWEITEDLKKHYNFR
jgi:uncharacterized protein